MNGEALTKRYEVRDAETGEVVEGPVHVLRPDHDAWANTAMYVYVRLCGAKDYALRQALVYPNKAFSRYLPNILKEEGLLSGGVSYTRDDLMYHPAKDRSEVTLAEADEWAAKFGLKLSGVVYQETDGL